MIACLTMLERIPKSSQQNRFVFVLFVS